MWRVAAVGIFVTGCVTDGVGHRERTLALWSDYAQRAPAGVTGAHDERAWAPGQFVVYAVETGAAKALVRGAVARRTREGVWLVMQTLTFDARETESALFAAQPGVDGAAVLRRVVVAPGGEPARVYDFETDDAAEVQAQRDVAVRRWALFIGAGGDGGSKGSVTTPAGRFGETTAVTVDGELLGRRVHLVGVRARGVPLGGLVEAASSDGAVSLRLVEFGDDGGAPLF